MIRIAPPEDFGPLDAASASVHSYDWIVFASANAVDVFIKRLLSTPLELRALKGVNLCAVGPATAEASVSGLASAPASASESGSELESVSALVLELVSALCSRSSSHRPL